MYDAYSAGDFEATIRDVHPDARAYPAIEPLEQGGLLEGRTAIRQFFESLRVWASRRVDFEEVIEVGDRVLLVERWVVQGRDGI
jgi:ketosteroid isomerase-like protein